MAAINKTMLIRREILTRIAKLVFDETLLVEIDKVPLQMRPRGSESSRCCIYRDRALIKMKIMAMLGYECNTDDEEMVPLSDYVLQSFVKAASDREIIRVVEAACHGCAQNNYVVTNMCRGCVGRPCEVNCPKDCIEFVGSRAIINADKCITCGICESVCPYHAIIYNPVPCEEACPVNAISKNERGKETIDFDKCTYCGKCMVACPFGAIVEESHLFDAIFSIKRNKKVVAMLAPSVAAQFKCTMPQLREAMLQMGFADVMYVALGADQTAREEAHELLESTELLTTSCCPAFVNLVEKHVPQLAGNISHTPSPMVFTARMAKELHPSARLLFVGPCMAKKAESFRVGGIDMVINFEELEAMLLAKGIDPATIEIDGKIPATAEGWNFAVSGGVLEAVKTHIPGEFVLNPLVINGLNKKAIALLKSAAKGNTYNFIEGMSCEGGCVAGCYMSTKPAVAKGRMDKLANSIRKG